MPYIRPDVRNKFDDSIDMLINELHIAGDKKGNLNYIITILIKDYITSKGISYDSLSDITGILNDVKTEFERMVVAPYEDKKISQNGGIY